MIIPIVVRGAPGNWGPLYGMASTHILANRWPTKPFYTNAAINSCSLA